ncbi:hypothetical protein FQN51_001216 [Onygenales sp. PD_10]|nr:hypothetical protein FQN51_001216 [Onygenales sp. PD_10]
MRDNGASVSANFGSSMSKELAEMPNSTRYEISAVSYGEELARDKRAGYAEKKIYCENSPVQKQCRKVGRWATVINKPCQSIPQEPRALRKPPQPQQQQPESLFVKTSRRSAFTEMGLGSTSTKSGPSSSHQEQKAAIPPPLPPRSYTEDSERTLVAGRPVTDIKGRWGTMARDIAQNLHGSTNFPVDEVNIPKNPSSQRIPIGPPEKPSKDRSKSCFSCFG